MSTPQLKRFSEIVAEFRGSMLDDDLTEKLHKLTAAVSATGKPGAIGLVLKFKKSGEISVEVMESVSVKFPPERSLGKTFFVDYEGRLTTRHPDQPALEFDASPATPTKEESK